MGALVILIGTLKWLPISLTAQCDPMRPPQHQVVDYDAVRADIRQLLTTSQPFWPADVGPDGPNYGPFFIRLAWHCTGSYRNSDGRGGCDGVCVCVYLFVCACAYVCVRELTNVPSSLVEQMKEVMHATEGVGIAAPQVGISKSLFVCEGK